jgi:hypothetical protein
MRDRRNELCSETGSLADLEIGGEEASLDVECVWSVTDLWIVEEGRPGKKTALLLAVYF